jgi:phthalate 4,5-dioxygenase
MIDREAQKTESYTGTASIHGQDQAVTESMGPITDHECENLEPSDIMIARTRRCLLRAARAFAKDGKVPPRRRRAGHLHPSAQRRFPRRQKNRAR